MYFLIIHVNFRTNLWHGRLSFGWFSLCISFYGFKHQNLAYLCISFLMNLRFKMSIDSVGVSRETLGLRWLNVFGRTNPHVSGDILLWVIGIQHFHPDKRTLAGPHFRGNCCLLTMFDLDLHWRTIPTRMNRLMRHARFHSYLSLATALQWLRFCWLQRNSLTLPDEIIYIATRFPHVTVWLWIREAHRKVRQLFGFCVICVWPSLKSAVWSFFAAISSFFRLKIHQNIIFNLLLEVPSSQDKHSSHF